MFKFILSFIFLFGTYTLPIPIEQARDYTKKTERVELDRDLQRINDRFFNTREPLVFKELKPGDDLAEAGKGSTIYFAYKGDGTPVAVIKKLPIDDPADREELNDEVSSLHERYFNKAKYFKVPRLIGTAEFADENRGYAYIIETMAQGRSINELVKKTAASKKDKRYAWFTTLKNSVDSTAKSFAELHRTKRYSSYSSYYDNYFSPVKDGKFKGPYGMIHGDAHLGNIFYDPKTKKTTFIDLSFLPMSVPKGAPVGLDSGKFLFTLQAIGAFYGLTDAEINELTNTYIKTYIAHNPKMTDDLLEQYTLIAYKDYAFPEDTFASDKTDQGSFLYRYAVNKVGKTEKTVIV